tara:strand:- start:1035 stop:1433 length:399 start_codon:yes stop_codon:yes gene_type:complete
MSTGKVKKIHRVTLLESRRGAYNCSVYYQQHRGWSFLPVLPGGGPAAAPVPSYPAARTRTIVPSKYPSRDFTSDSPGNTSSPGNSQPSIVAPNPNNSSVYYPDSLLAPVAAGPAGILTRTICRLIPQIRCWA